MSAEKIIKQDFDTSVNICEITEKDKKLSTKESNKKGASEREEGELVSESDAENDEILQIELEKQVQQKVAAPATSPSCVDDIIVLDVSQEDINLLEADKEFIYADYEEGEVISSGDYQNMIEKRKSSGLKTKKIDEEKIKQQTNVVSAECETLNKILIDMKDKDTKNFTTEDDPEDGEIQSPPNNNSMEVCSNTNENSVEIKHETDLMNTVAYAPIEVSTKYNASNQAVIEVINIGENELIISTTDAVNCQATTKDVEFVIEAYNKLEMQAMKSNENTKKTDEIVNDAAAFSSNFENIKQNVANVEYANKSIMETNIQNFNEKMIDDNNNSAQQKTQDDAIKFNESIFKNVEEKSNEQKKVDKQNKTDSLNDVDNNVTPIEVNLKDGNNNNNQAVFKVSTIGENNIVEVGKIVHITAEGINVELNIGEQVSLKETTATELNNVQVKTDCQNAETLPLYCIEFVVQNIDENNSKNINNKELNVKFLEVVESENQKNSTKAHEIEKNSKIVEQTTIKTATKNESSLPVKDNTLKSVWKETTPKIAVNSSEHIIKRNTVEPETTLPFFGPEWLFPSPKRLVSSRLENADQSPSPRLYRKERKLKIFSSKEKPYTNRPKPYDKIETIAPITSIATIAPKPETSRMRRSHRLPYCPYTTQTRISLHILTLYDQHGRLRRNGADICDCGNHYCDGCWYNCFECGSPKCGLSCRRNRQVYPDSWHLKTPRRTQY